jgi:hypothetical protein
MNIFRRLLTYIDNQTGTALDRHLELALPSRSPDQVVGRFLPSRQQVEQIGSHPCCACCPPACTEVHRDACPVHQSGALA